MLVSKGSLCLGYRVHLWNLYAESFVFPPRWWETLFPQEQHWGSSCLLALTGQLELEQKRGFWRCDLSPQANIFHQNSSQAISLLLIHFSISLMLFWSGLTLVLWILLTVILASSWGNHFVVVVTGFQCLQTNLTLCRGSNVPFCGWFDSCMYVGSELWHVSCCTDI